MKLRSWLLILSLSIPHLWDREAGATPLELGHITGTFTVPEPHDNVQISQALFRLVFGQVETLAQNLPNRGSGVINIGIYQNVQHGTVHTNQFYYVAGQPHQQATGVAIENTNVNLFEAYSNPRDAMHAFLLGNNTPGNCGENALPATRPPAGGMPNAEGRLIGSLSFIIGKDRHGVTTLRLLNFCGTCSAGHQFLIDFAGFLRGTAEVPLTEINIPGRGNVPIPEFPAGDPRSREPSQAQILRAMLDLFRRFLGEDFNYANGNHPSPAELTRLRTAMETGEGSQATCSTRRWWNRLQMARDTCRSCARAAGGPVLATLLFMGVAELADAYIGQGAGFALGAGALSLGLYIDAAGTLRFMGPQVGGAVAELGLNAVGCPQPVSTAGGVAAAGGIGACIGGPPGAVTAAAVYSVARLMHEVGNVLDAHVEGGRILERSVEQARQAAKRRCLVAIMNCQQPLDGPVRDGKCQFQNHHHHHIETMGSHLTTSDGGSTDFRDAAAEMLRQEMQRHLDRMRAQRRLAEERTNPRDPFNLNLFNDIRRLNDAFRLPCDANRAPPFTPRRPAFGTGLRPVRGTGTNSNLLGVDDHRWAPGRGPVFCRDGNCNITNVTDDQVIDLCVDGSCPNGRCRLADRVLRPGHPVGDRLDDLAVARWNEPGENGEDPVMRRVEEELERLVAPATFRTEMGNFLNRMCAAADRNAGQANNRLPPGRCDPCE